MNTEFDGTNRILHDHWRVERSGHDRLAINVVHVFLALCLLLGMAGCVQNPDAQGQSMSGTDMAEANQHYENGAYDEAAQRYQAIIDATVADGAVYYNLGNAYFKSGDLGGAILNYRRAQRLLPRDPDVSANLQLARAQTRDRLERDGNGLAGFVNYVLVGWSTTDEVALVALVFWLLLCGCVVVAIRWQRQRRYLRWIMLVLSVGLVLSVLSLGIRLVDAQQPHAVVVASSIEVRSGPGTDYLIEFSLHTGAEVRVLERRSAWVRIALPGNLQGWVPDGVVENL